MSDPVYLSTDELNEIAEDLDGVDASIEPAVAAEYGIDESEIFRIMDGRGYEFDEDTNRWAKIDQAKCGWKREKPESGEEEKKNSD